jgi:hypothetical protein
MSCEAITSQNLTKKVEGQIKDSGQHKRNYFYCKKNYFITKTLCLSKEINNKLLLSFPIFLFQHCHSSCFCCRKRLYLNTIITLKFNHIHNFFSTQTYQLLMKSNNVSFNESHEKQDSNPHEKS